MILIINCSVCVWLWQHWELIAHSSIFLSFLGFAIVQILINFRCFLSYRRGDILLIALTSRPLLLSLIQSWETILFLNGISSKSIIYTVFQQTLIYIACIWIIFLFTLFLSFISTWSKQLSFQITKSIILSSKLLCLIFDNFGEWLYRISHSLRQLVL